jgi:hypothetical protein
LHGMKLMKQWDIHQIAFRTFCVPGLWIVMFYGTHNA